MKILVIGSSGVGKTNLIMKFSNNQFTNSHLATIGIDFKMKNIQLGEERVKLQIWDTAGQEKFRTITQSYYRGAMGIILTYAIDERESFEELGGWMDQVRQYAPENVVRVLVGCKSDMSGRVIAYKEGKKMADSLEVEFFEVSAKTGDHVEEVFRYVAEKIK